MKLSELMEFCQGIPDEAEIAVVKCSDMIEDGGRGIDKLEYYLTSDEKDGILFIRLE